MIWEVWFWLGWMCWFGVDAGLGSFNSVVSLIVLLQFSMLIACWLFVFVCVLGVLCVICCLLYRFNLFSIWPVLFVSCLFGCLQRLARFVCLTWCVGFVWLIVLLGYVVFAVFDGSFVFDCLFDWLGCLFIVIIHVCFIA